MITHTCPHTPTLLMAVPKLTGCYALKKKVICRVEMDLENDS